MNCTDSIRGKQKTSQSVHISIKKHRHGWRVIDNITHLRDFCQ